MSYPRWTKLRAAARLLPLALLGCREAPPPPLSLRGSGGGAPMLRLLDHRSEASLRLPAASLPPEGPSGGRFRLDQGWQRVRGGRVWQRPAPIPLPHLHYTTAPTGVRLEDAAGVSLPYTNGLLERATPTGSWEVVEGTLYLSSPTDPGKAPPRLHSAPTAEAERRLDPTASGLAPADYVSERITVAGHTRDALLLPAPAEVRYTVTLPTGAARLRFGAALYPPPVSAWEGAARLSVEVEGASIWSLEARAGEPWTEVSLDLSPWAGQTIDLRLQAERLSPDAAGWAAFATPELSGTPSTLGPRRVVLVGVDTLRLSHLSREGYPRPTTPHLDALAAESVVFSEARAPAPRTRPSFRTLLTGREPLAAIGAPTLAEAFAAAGWSTAGFVANVHLIPRLGMADGFRWWEYLDSAPAAHQVDRTLSWLTEHQGEDSLVFLHLMDPHVFYTPPPPYLDRFTTGLDPGDLPDNYNRWLVRRWEEAEPLTPAKREFMIARYDGELAYIDDQLDRLVQAIDRLPGQTTLVLTSDHGEEFWEHGGFEHNHTLYDELLRTVLWIRPPKGGVGAEIDAPTALADVAPTLLDLAGLPPIETDGLSLAPLLQGSLPPAPLLQQLIDRPLAHGHMMFAPEQWAVTTRGHKYILSTGSGAEQLFDLRADPGEHHDLSASAPLDPYRAALHTATGWPVGPGWRIALTKQRGGFTLTFSEPLLAAGVIDPEALRDHRANLEWGEIPPSVPTDVGVVTLSADRRTVTFRPGPKGTGRLYLLGPTATAVATTDTGATVQAGSVTLGEGAAVIEVGTVIVPEDSEAKRLAGNHDPDAIESLRALGYVE